jgi:hypothetical protein
MKVHHMTGDPLLTFRAFSLPTLRYVIPITVAVGLQSKVLGEPSPVQDKNGAPAFVATDATL